MCSAVESQSAQSKNDDTHSKFYSPWEKQLQYIPYPRIKNLMQSLDIELSDLCKVSPIVETEEKTHTECLLRPLKISPSEKIRNPYKCRAYEAYKRRKIFTVYGAYGVIRRALLSRGWLEKLPPGKLRKLQSLPDHVLQKEAKPGNEYEIAAISQAINFYPPFFIWQPKRQRDYAAEVLPYRNRVRRAPQLDFSTKIGLIGCAECSHWHGEYELNYPRFYRLDISEEIPQFTADYRITQCLSLLSFVCDTTDPTAVADYRLGTVKLTILNFAIRKIEEDLMEKANCFIDMPKKLNSEESDDEESEWLQFITGSNLIVKQLNKFNATENQFASLVLKAKPTLEMAKLKRPTIQMDGYRNLWILKPGYQCRGLGIAIMGNLNAILDYASKRFRSKYIAQKYIERPYLIYKTKFDIRQYLVVSITRATVDIWIYKNCYLRFSSQEFSFENLNESVHLTNNSVQKKYKNGLRDVRLPVNNMWSLLQFRNYLTIEYGTTNVWEEKIKPEIKQNLIAVVLSSLEETVLTPNSFEIYGCDLMLDESLKPILIEVNSTPDMSPSTSVTAHICNEALKDLIKVIVDLPLNSSAPTGDFELVHQIDRLVTTAPPKDLTIVGVPCKLFPMDLMKRRIVRKKSRLVLSDGSESTIVEKFDNCVPPDKHMVKNGKKKQKLHPNRLNPKLILKKSQQVRNKIRKQRQSIKGSKRKVTVAKKVKKIDKLLEMSKGVKSSKSLMESSRNLKTMESEAAEKV